MAESLDFGIGFSLMYLTGLKNPIDTPKSPLKRGTFLVPPEIHLKKGDRGIGTVLHQTPECCKRVGTRNRGWKPYCTYV
jgi:hypothetical protein